MKSFRFVVGSFVLLLLAGLLVLRAGVARNTDTIWHRIAIILFDFNPIEVEAIGIPRSSVSIVWRSDGDSMLVVEHGEQIARVGNEYGPNGFDVYVDGRIVGRVGHVKLANWSTHDYHIRLERADTGVVVRLDASDVDTGKQEE